MRRMIQQRWSGLSSRDRMVVMGLGCLMAPALVFVLVLDPLLERLEKLDRHIAAKQRAIQQLAVLGADYTIARAQQAQVDGRIAAGEGRFSLLSYLEESASAAQIRDHITAMQPQVSISSLGYKETSAEVRLEGASFPKFLMLLIKLEKSSYLLQIKRLHVKPRFDMPHLLDTTLVVSTYDKE